jgi:hypothetical protein
MLHSRRRRRQRALKGDGDHGTFAESQRDHIRVNADCVGFGRVEKPRHIVALFTERGGITSRGEA